MIQIGRTKCHFRLETFYRSIGLAITLIQHIIPIKSLYSARAIDVTANCGSLFEECYNPVGKINTHVKTLTAIENI